MLSLRPDMESLKTGMLLIIGAINLELTLKDSLEEKPSAEEIKEKIEKM